MVVPISLTLIFASSLKTVCKAVWNSLIFLQRLFWWYFDDIIFVYC